jgi:hypothetical protein
MNRRSFITALGGAAVWPSGASVQRPQRMRRISVLVAAEEQYRPNCDIAPILLIVSL